MSGVHQIVVCAACVREGAGYIELVYEAHEDGSSVWRCPNCLTVGIVYSNMGMLDLGLRRDELVEDRNDYRLFTGAFEAVARSGGLCAPAIHESGVVRSSVLSDVVSYELYAERRWWRRGLRKLWPW